MSYPLRRRGKLRSGSSAAGFVLVTVLIVLALLVVLVVAFLLRVTTERTNAVGFRGSASARSLADMAVGLVQGQVVLATSQEPTNVWCSQPGMVRTYDSSGNFYNGFKLYSSTNMVVAPAAGGIDITADVPPATWTTDVAFWDDLNSPVQTPGGTTVYPIVNPSATNAATGVSGFSFTAPPGATAGQPLPMPVRWLYVLEDGSLVAPTGSGSVATVAGETPSNKIVGRIAFWTDDNTCRVNINTASAGTFWDVPRGYTTLATANAGIPTPGSLTQEQAYGYYQPVQHEFQRYPGHPAMTDLRAVFTNATPAQIYSIVPRIVGGGSTQGTLPVAVNSTLVGYPKTAPNSRLYANVDEMLFQGDHKTPNNPINTTSSAITPAQLEAAKFFLTAQSRAPEVNLFGLPRIASWPINADYDPLNNPTSLYTTAFDRLIALCSSTGPTTASDAYYFTRKNALSSVTDINLANASGVKRNQQLYQYLQYLTSQAIPGFGTTTFLQKYPAPTGLPSDRDQILTEIFDYIRSLNLYDTTLDATTVIGKYEYTGTGVTGLNAKGYVAPTVNGTGVAATTTLGFGRAYTLAQFGIAFICNADANYSASDQIAGTSINRVLQGTALPANSNQKYIQAMLIPEFFSVMEGFISMMPNMQMKMSGLSALKVNGVSLFPNDAEGPISYHDLRADGSSLSVGASFSTQLANIYGALPGWRYALMGQDLGAAGNPGSGRAAPARGGFVADTNYESYPFVSNPVLITDTNGTMTFTGGTITLTLMDQAGNTVQTFLLNLPDAPASTPFPTPKIAQAGTVSPNPTLNPQLATTQENWWAFNKTGAISNGTATVSVKPGRLSFVNSTTDSISPATLYSGIFLRNDIDVLRTILPVHGDYRLIAGMNTVPATVFQPHRYYLTSAQMFASNFSNNTDTRLDSGFDNGGKYISGITYPGGHEPDIPATATSPNTPESTGDYDDSLPDVFPGPYANKPDEGSVPKTTQTKSIPYYNPLLTSTTAAAQGIDVNSDGGAFFSPNRMMPSPGMFGSLPTGVMAGVPWRTLLFRPQAGHYGATSPADHLLLDLFWMPVVEPYAISDRFSTAGKINLNYQILPFTYLKRQTGLYALLQSEMVTAMPDSQISVLKSVGAGTQLALRNKVDISATLLPFDTKFSGGDVFKSASEICTQQIVPCGGSGGVTTGVNTAAGMANYWTHAGGHSITGDNVREKIYTTLYPRLTTKSNTYTVYFTAQSLKKASTSPYGIWTEGRDTVLGEYRGSAEVERFIDANNTSIPNYAADIAANGGLPSSDPPLDSFYRWRVISNRQFAP